MKNLLETQQSQVIRNSFKKLKVGHFLQGLAFLIMLIILFITYLTSKDAVQNISLNNLQESSDKLSDNLSLIKYGGILSLIILIVSSFYLSLVSVDPIEEEIEKIIDVIGSTIKLDNWEIAEKDFPEKMNWADAKIACKTLSNGWRLPTKEELAIIYQNKDEFKGFDDSGYWSSTEDNYSLAWGQGFKDGKQLPVKKATCLKVRPVRNVEL